MVNGCWTKPCTLHRQHARRHHLGHADSLLLSDDVKRIGDDHDGTFARCRDTQRRVAPRTLLWCRRAETEARKQLFACRQSRRHVIHSLRSISLRTNSINEYNELVLSLRSNPSILQFGLSFRLWYFRICDHAERSQYKIYYLPVPDVWLRDQHHEMSRNILIMKSM